MLAVQSRKNRSSLFSPATLQFVRAAWEVHDHSLRAVVHSYVYARWPYLYIGIGKGDHVIARRLAPFVKVWSRLFPQKEPRPVPAPSPTRATGTFADGYHAKVMLLDQARQLVTIDQPVDLPDLEQVIPYVRARALIQHHPDQIIVMECPCRVAKEDPCQPLDVCLVVGEPFVSFLLEHHPSRSRRISQQEAVQVLEREDARGRVHHAFFNDPMLGRFFGICNCCACCCAAMKAHRRGTPMLASSGSVAQVDVDLCYACGTCAGYCQFGAIVTRDGQTHVDHEACMGCGVCVSHCPQEAITLRQDAGKGVPLELRALLEDRAPDPAGHWENVP